MKWQAFDLERWEMKCHNKNEYGHVRAEYDNEQLLIRYPFWEQLTMNHGQALNFYKT